MTGDSRYRNFRRDKGKIDGKKVKYPGDKMTPPVLPFVTNSPHGKTNLVQHIRNEA